MDIRLPGEFRRFHYSLYLAAAFLVANHHCRGQEPKRPSSQVEVLITQLGSDNHAVREEASRRLIKMPGAGAALRAATRSNDPEIARRAVAVLRVRAREESGQSQALMTSLAKAGEVDLAVECLIHRDTSLDDTTCWQVLDELGATLSRLEKEKYRTQSLKIFDKIPLPADDFVRYFNYFRPTAFSSQAPLVLPVRKAKAVGERTEYLARAPTINAPGPVSYSLLASSGDIRWAEETGPCSSLVLSGGSVVADSPTHCIIVCAGDCSLKRGVGYCLIIAGGSVNCPESVGRSRIFAGGKITYPKDRVLAPCVFEEGASKPLDFVRFFDVSRLGLALDDGPGEPRVKTLERGTALDRAGLRPGDGILSVAGEKVTSAESLRRLLRTQLVDGEEFSLVVRRGDRTLTLTPTLSLSAVKAPK